MKKNPKEVCLVAIDPGKSSGVAIFRGQELKAAWLITEDNWKLTRTVAADRVVVEIPEVRRDTKNPASLITLAFSAGDLAGQFGTREIECIKPPTWKGSRPKEVDNRYTLGLLNDQERPIVLASVKAKSKLHNVIDAVGIGLWALGRRR